MLGKKKLFEDYKVNKQQSQFANLMEEQRNKELEEFKNLELKSVSSQDSKDNK